MSNEYEVYAEGNFYPLIYANLREYKKISVNSRRLVDSLKVVRKP